VQGLEDVGKLTGPAGYCGGGYNVYGGPAGCESDWQTMRPEGAAKVKHVLYWILSIQFSGGGECITHAGLCVEMNDYRLLIR